MITPSNSSGIATVRSMMPATTNGVSPMNIAGRVARLEIPRERAAPEPRTTTRSARRWWN
jgi:hypothetical protein